MHNITSARFANPMPDGSYPPDAAVIVQHALYGEQCDRRANDDIDGGGMLAFLRDGGVIGSYEPPPAPVPVVPASVARWRIRMALLTRTVPATADTPEHAMLDAADALAVAAGGSVLIYWRDTLEIERAHPLTAQFGAALGLSPADIDAVFMDAMTY